VVYQFLLDSHSLQHIIKPFPVVIGTGLCLLFNLILSVMQL